MNSEQEGKRPVGRPRVETRLPEGWKDIIIQAGKEGKHITDFLITLGIAWDTHYSMMERNKEYSSAVNEYNKYCEHYWFEMARQSMEETEGAGFNSRLWSLILRNKFPKHWSEASKIDVTTGGEKIENNKPITIEIIKTRNDGANNEDTQTGETV
jgi:hypothetical protein